VNPNLPIIVGVGQVTRSEAEREAAVDPLDLVEEAARQAVQDTGAPGIAGSIDAVSVARGLFWPYKAPAGWLAERLGAPAGLVRMAPPSGVHAQALLHDSALRIHRGELRAALVVGGDAAHTRRAAERRGEAPAHRADVDDDREPDEVHGIGERVHGLAEKNAGLDMPAPVYALVESALRHRDGVTPEAHRAELARLYAALAAVAAANPHAWDRHPWTAPELLTATGANRMLAHPYSARFVARWSVDQAAAVLVCAAGEARRLGIDPARSVFLAGAADSRAIAPVSQRPDVATHPAVGRTGRRALALAGVGADELDLVDLYSCFPSAVRVQARELGLPLAPVPSVTGGMAFAGGPVNSYALHSLATTVGRLRAGGAGLGLVSSVGGVLDKQSFTVLSTAPPRLGFRHDDLTAANERDRREHPVELDAAGPAVILGSTVTYDAEGPRAVLLVELEDGARSIVATRASDVVGEAEDVEMVGRRVQVAGSDAVGLGDIR
jgi:acetyl-CoA C-acetyltransferase